MLRVRELAAMGMERSAVKAGMTEAGHGYRTWIQDMDTGHGDRGGTGMMETGHGGRTWRPGMDTRNGDKERVESQEVSGRSLP